MRNLLGGWYSPPDTSIRSLIERAASRLRVGVERVDAEILGRLDHFAFTQPRDHLRVAPAADLGEAGDAANGLLALVPVAAEQQVGDAFLGDDVRRVVGIDHDRCQRQVELLGQRQRGERLVEQRRIAFAEGLADLHDQLAATPQQRRPVGIGLRTGLEPRLARWRRPRGSEPILGAPPKPAMRLSVTVELWPLRSICSVEPMNMSQA